MNQEQQQYYQQQIPASVVADMIQQIMAGVQTMHNHRPPTESTAWKDVDKFSDQDKEWSAVEWLAKVTSILSTGQNQLGVAEVQATSAKLTGRAWRWYVDRFVAAGNVCPFNSWQAFEAEFLRQFQPTNAQRKYRRELVKLKQKNTVAEYNDEFRAVKARIAGATEDELFTYYLEGLKPDTKAEVDYRNPATVDEAMRIAETYDESKYRHRSPAIH